MYAMKAVIDNRLSYGPGIFGARGAEDYADIVTARGQWEGFSSGPRMSGSVSSRIDEIVSVANSQRPGGSFRQHVETALRVAGDPIRDPYSDLTTIGGERVEPGVFGWRTSGSSQPGGSFVMIPEGDVGGNQFYTILHQGGDWVGNSISGDDGSRPAAPNSTPQCDRIGFATSTEAGYENHGRALYSGYVSNTRLDVELYYQDGGREAAFKSESWQNYATCSHCVLLASGCDESGRCSREFLVTDGTLEITVNEPSLGRLAGSLSNLRAVEVTIDQNYRSTPVSGGEVWCLEQYQFDVQTRSF